MRTVIFLTGLLWSLNTAAQATFQAGGAVSLNTSWIINQNAYEILEKICSNDPLIAGSEPAYSITTGYTVGAALGYELRPAWGLYLELNYAKAGQHYQDSWDVNACENDLSDFERKFTLHYLQLPLMVRVGSKYRRKVKAYFEAGPQVGVLLGASETISLGGAPVQGVEFTPADEKVALLDLGLVLGGGAKMALSDNLRLVTGVRTYIGLLDINDGAAEAFISANDTAYQRSRNFALGLHVGLLYVFDWMGSIYQ